MPKFNSEWVTTNRLNCLHRAVGLEFCSLHIGMVYLHRAVRDSLRASIMYFTDKVVFINNHTHRSSINYLQAQNLNGNPQACNYTQLV
jgi:hypothetical protein